MEDLIIRDARSAPDMALVRGLLVEYERSLGIDLCFQGFAEELAALPGKYARPEGRLLLAMNDGSAMGVVALRALKEGACEMKRLYVRPLGRRLGLGRLLTKALIEEARLAGYRKMLLDTLPGMSQAQALYRSLGFTEIAAYVDNPIVGTKYLCLQL